MVRCQTPMMFQSLAFIEADGQVGVADINGQEHGFYQEKEFVEDFTTHLSLDVDGMGDWINKLFA